jgi:hypothetical protein
MQLRLGLLPAILLVGLVPACGSDGTPSPGNPDGSSGLDGPPGSLDSAMTSAPSMCAALLPTSEVRGSVSQDQTWSGVVAVTANVTVRDGAKITIAPGTTVVMGPDTSIEFGWNSNAASIFANGTEAAPIRFCGRQAMPGYFKILSFEGNVTSDSVLENVIISDGGQGTEAALKLQAPILVKNVRIEGSGADGVHAIDFKEGSANLTITGAAKTAAVLLGPGAVMRLPLGGTFTGNGTDAIGLRFTTIGKDTTFRNPGVPYVQEKTVTTRDGSTVRFEPGVDYRLVVDTKLEVGWNSNEASIMAAGTAENPVVFGPVSQTAGNFGSIIIEHRVRSDSEFRHTKITGGGSGAPVLDVRAAITVDHLTLDNNNTGLKLAGPGFSARSTALTITKTAAQTASVQPNTAITLPKGGTYSGNTQDWISVAGGTYTAKGTLANLGVPYRIESKINTRDASELTIEAGTTLLMAADSNFEFGWNSNQSTITAVGTAESPIVFKGVNDVPGYWNGIIIERNVVSSSKLDYVRLENGGKADGAALILHRANFDVTNSKFSKSAGYGIKKPASDPTDYAAKGNTFEMNALGTVGSL